MDTFHRVEFTGTWRRLFSRVKKHIIWGVLKSVTGMQVYCIPLSALSLSLTHKHVYMHRLTLTAGTVYLLTNEKDGSYVP